MELKKQVLGFLFKDQVTTEDMILKEFNITEDELEEIFDELEEDGYMRVDDEYFENTCDKCQKGGNCSTEQYHPKEKVKKIRVLTLKAVNEYIGKIKGNTPA